MMPRGEMPEGRTGLTRNQLWQQCHPGFESCLSTIFKAQAASQLGLFFCVYEYATQYSMPVDPPAYLASVELFEALLSHYWLPVALHGEPASAAGVLAPR